MATNYSVQPPAKFSSQLTTLQEFAAEHPRSRIPVPPGKADPCKKLITALDNEELAVEVRSALSVESICLPLVLEAIELHPSDLAAQMAYVRENVRNVPEYQNLMDRLRPDQTEGTTQPDQTEGTTQPDQTEGTTQPDQTEGTTQPDQLSWVVTPSCTRPCAVHGFDLDWTALPDPADYDPRNIHAAGQLCQIRVVGDAIINTVNTLRDTRWNKSFDPQDSDLCNNLYCWGEERDRVPDPNVLYARTLGRANTAFIPRWNGLVAAVSAFMDSRNSTAVRKPDSTPVHTAAFALQAYLDSAVTGIIRMQINDCAAHLAKAIEILNHHEVRVRFGTGREPNLWSVVAASLNSDSLTADLKPKFDNAQAIRSVFDWLELFPELTDQLNNKLFHAIAVIRHPHGTALPANQEVPALPR